MDLDNLRASGLTDETIRENELRTVKDSRWIAEHLNRELKKGQYLGGLVIPYRDLKGHRDGFVRVRPHCPRMVGGREIKYEQPVDEPLRAYYPKASIRLLHDKAEPIYITEGEKKALCLSQLCLAAVGIGGVDCWGKDGALIEDLAEIDWQGREVYIVFDFDEKPKTRRNVDSARKRFAKALKAAGVTEVYSVEVPPGPDGGKQGVDDFLVANDASAFRKLVDSASIVDLQPACEEMHLINLADVEPRDVSWLWPYRIPAGKLTLLCGDPGLGKSHLTMDVAARVSQGSRWPDDATQTAQGCVIIFSAEDDIADTIRPRLDRAGADVQKIFCLESMKKVDAKTGKSRHAAFSLAEHLPLLEEHMAKIGDVRLIIIDPISNYTGKTDSHVNSDVRMMLAPLIDLAERSGVAILAVTHLNKETGGKAVYRSTGSLAFAATARSVLMLAKDLEDPDRRLLLPVKCNLTEEPLGLAFYIDSDSGGSFVRWDDQPVNITADGYLAAEGKQLGTGHVALERAMEFVREQLKTGPILSTELDAAASANDISKATLRRAKDRLGCQAVKQKKDGKWAVKLPSEPDQPAQHEHDEHLEHVDGSPKKQLAQEAQKSLGGKREQDVPTPRSDKRRNKAARDKERKQAYRKCFGNRPANEVRADILEAIKRLKGAK